MRVPHGEAWHVVYGNCPACNGTGAIDWHDIVETLRDRAVNRQDAEDAEWRDRQKAERWREAQIEARHRAEQNFWQRVHEEQQREYEERRTRYRWRIPNSYAPLTPDEL